MRVVGIEQSEFFPFSVNFKNFKSKHLENERIRENRDSLVLGVIGRSSTAVAWASDGRGEEFRQRWLKPLLN